MKQFKYILEKYSGSKSRHDCPSCGKRKTFAYYLDSDTYKFIDPSVGRCNREDKCGYHLTPKQYFESNGIEYVEYKPMPVKEKEPLPELILDASLMEKSLTGYDSNHFVNYLISLFGDVVASELVSKYFIGTSKHWEGSTVFWQVDTKGMIKAGKVMLYNAETGKRVKDPFNHIQWVHKLVDQDGEFELKQCFFGEYLLRDTTKTAAIVESEKTAIIASVYFPDLIWLACGGLSMLTFEKCQALKERDVVLFPDLNGFERWTEKVDLFLPKIARSYSVSSLLEKVSTKDERKQGLDLADYLIRYKPADFSVNIGDFTNDNIKDDTSTVNGYKSLVSLLRELSIKVPESLTFSIEGKQNECFKTFVDDTLKAYEQAPDDKTVQNNIRHIYRTMDNAGDKNFTDKY